MGDVLLMACARSGLVMAPELWTQSERLATTLGGTMSEQEDFLGQDFLGDHSLAR